MVIAIDNFFGCYLLFSINPKYKGRTYIGFTVNPERRIKQHNRGRAKGGAWRTSGRGPWEMVLVVHGFPSDIAALRFEWAWQNPHKSRRLKEVVTAKRRKESAFQYRVRVMSSMLNQAPWKMLPLTVRWLKQEYSITLASSPPLHMPIAYGQVTAKVKKHKAPDDDSEKLNTSIQSEKSSEDDIAIGSQSQNSEADDSEEECIPLLQRIKNKANKTNLNDKCSTQPDRMNKQRTDGGSSLKCSICVCSLPLTSSLSCLNPKCKACFHLVCLSRHFLKGHSDKHAILPVEGSCPICSTNLLWGDLIRESQGFHQYLKQDS